MIYNIFGHNEFSLGLAFIVVPGSTSELGLSLYIACTNILVNAISRRINRIREEVKDFLDSFHSQLQSELRNSWITKELECDSSSTRILSILQPTFEIEANNINPISNLIKRLKIVLGIWKMLEKAVNVGVLMFVSLGLVLLTAMIFNSLICATGKGAMSFKFLLVFLIPVWVISGATAYRIVLLAESGEQLQKSVINSIKISIIPTELQYFTTTIRCKIIFLLRT